jgi:uncharacterized protein with ParB-like and HNH nuclease domain
MDNNIEKFFTGKFFHIPNYQREYAWDTENVDDLFEDILEAIETDTTHFIGTFILATGSKKPWFHVVDGQQRLTTLVMLFNAVIQKLGTKRDQIINLDKFVCSEIENVPTWKLELLNDNDEFFKAMLEGKKPKPNTRSQQLLITAYEHIQSRVKTLPVPLQKFLDAMRSLEVMELTEDNDGKAIRMFQTVNDRGKLLTNMEKAKSLLIYYSNRFLDGALDESINAYFGKIFRAFSEIKSIGEEYEIDVISSKRFSEDSIMRYHYLAYANDLYDYDANESYVLDIYLKKTLKPLRASKVKLEKFILDYIQDLDNFYKCLLAVVQRVKTVPKYYKLFSLLGISANLYPLIIRLETRGFLESPLKHMKGKQFIDLIEIADFRVYKMRGTNPRVDMALLARDAKKKTPSDIENTIRSFIERFMGDDEFEHNMKSNNHNTPTTHLIIEYCEQVNNKPYIHSELRKFKKSQPTVEHIFPEKERFSFPNLGFNTIDEYKYLIQTIGNLTALEKTINSQCQNKTPDQKVSGGYYDHSIFYDAKSISSQLKNSGLAFKKEDVEKRTNQLTAFVKKRWQI